MTENCFVCKRPIEQDEEDREHMGRFVNDGGLWFEAHGGWPSAVLDPLVDETDAYVLFICDECIRENGYLVYRVLRVPKRDDIVLLGKVSDPSKHRETARPRCHGQYDAVMDSCRECRFRVSCRHALKAPLDNAVTGG